jgi:hypothetical protein
MDQQNKTNLYRKKCTHAPTRHQRTGHWARSNAPVINILPTAKCPPSGRRIFACPFQLPINLQPPKKGTPRHAFKHYHVDLQSGPTRNLNSSPSAKLHQKSANTTARTPWPLNDTKKQPDKVNCTEGNGNPARPQLNYTTQLNRNGDCNLKS